MTKHQNFTWKLGREPHRLHGLLENLQGVSGQLSQFFDGMCQKIQYPQTAATIGISWIYNRKHEIEDTSNPTSNFRGSGLSKGLIEAAPVPLAAAAVASLAAGCCR